MPDIVSLLERAAAPPTRPPDVDGPMRRRRRRRVLVGAASVVVVTVGVAAVAIGRGAEHATVRVQEPTPSTTTTTGPSTTVTSKGVSIDVPHGWYTTPAPLAWWLTSPFELFSIATTPLPPAPHKAQNEAVCPSEIPTVAVDNLPSDGAFLWIGEWHQGGVGYTATPRTPTQDLVLYDLCPLPNGLKGYGATLHDGTHDYEVSIVLGPDAPPERRAEINRMLDSLRFTAP